MIWWKFSFLIFEGPSKCWIDIVSDEDHDQVIEKSKTNKRYRVVNKANSKLRKTWLIERIFSPFFSLEIENFNPYYQKWLLIHQKTSSPKNPGDQKSTKNFQSPGIKNSSISGIQNPRFWKSSIPGIKISRFQISPIPRIIPGIPKKCVVINKSFP